MTSTIPTLKVEMAFLTGSVLGSAFTLDDATKGVLADTGGSPNNVLLAPGYIDITAKVSGSIQVNRGRSRELDSFNAGTASFTLRNEDRSFDPLNTTSAYYPGITPRTLVRISVAGTVVFVGRVEDYLLRYDINGLATVDVSCVDGLGILASMFLVNVDVDEEFPETRIPAVFNNAQINYPDPISIVGLSQNSYPAGRSGGAGIAVMSSANSYAVVAAWSDSGQVTKGTTSLSVLPFTGLVTPVGVAVDSSDNVYVTDISSNNVKKLVGSTQTTLAFGSLSGPSGIAVAPSGNVYVCDTNNGRVRKLTVSTGVVTSLSTTNLILPFSIAIDNVGTFYVADGNDVKRLDGASWTTLTIPGLTSPGGICIGPDNALYVSDNATNRVYRVSTSGTAAVAFSNLSNPAGVATDSAKNVYVVDSGNNRICKTSYNVRLLAKETLADVSVLEHLQRVEKAEYGWMFVDRQGTLVIESRPDLTGTPVFTFGDAPGQTHYETIQMLSATQLLYNQVVASGTAGANTTSQSGNRQVANDLTSQSTYLVRTYDMSSTALAYDADAVDLANYILSLYKNPEVRFDMMTVNFLMHTSTFQASLAALDIGSIVTVVFHPPTSADASLRNRVDLTSPGISLAQCVESISYTFDITGSNYKATYTFGSVGI